MHHAPLTVAVLKLGVGVEFYVADAVAPGGEEAEWSRLKRMLRRTGEGAEVRDRLRGAAGKAVSAAAVGASASLARLPNEGLPPRRGRRAVWADRHNAPTAAISGVAKVESVADGVETRRVSAKGIVHLSGLRWVIGRAFAGEVVKLRPLLKEAGIAVDFRGWPLGVATDAKTTAAGDAWAYRLGSNA